MLIKETMLRLGYKSLCKYKVPQYTSTSPKIAPLVMYTGLHHREYYFATRDLAALSFTFNFLLAIHEPIKDCDPAHKKNTNTCFII